MATNLVKNYFPGLMFTGLKPVLLSNYKHLTQNDHLLEMFFASLFQCRNASLATNSHISMLSDFIDKYYQKDTCPQLIPCAHWFISYIESLWFIIKSMLLFQLFNKIPSKTNFRALQICTLYFITINLCLSPKVVKNGQLRGKTNIY